MYYYSLLKVLKRNNHVQLKFTCCAKDLKIIPFFFAVLNMPSGSSAWASRMKVGKMVLVAVLALHIGTYYVKPLLIPEKNLSNNEDDIKK